MSALQSITKEAGDGKIGRSLVVCHKIIRHFWAELVTRSLWVWSYAKKNITCVIPELWMLVLHGRFWNVAATPKRWRRNSPWFYKRVTFLYIYIYIYYIYIYTYLGGYYPYSSESWCLAMWSHNWYNFFMLLIGCAFCHRLECQNRMNLLGNPSGRSL